MQRRRLSGAAGSPLGDGTASVRGLEAGSMRHASQRAGAAPAGRTDAGWEWSRPCRGLCLAWLATKISAAGHWMEAHTPHSSESAPPRLQGEGEHARRFARERGQHSRLPWTLLHGRARSSLTLMAGGGWQRWTQSPCTAWHERPPPAPREPPDRGTHPAWESVATRQRARRYKTASP